MAPESALQAVLEAWTCPEVGSPGDNLKQPTSELNPGSSCVAFLVFSVCLICVLLCFLCRF